MDNRPGFRYTEKDFTEAENTPDKYAALRRTDMINTLVEVYGYERSDISSMPKGRLEYEYEACVDNISWKWAFEEV
ncbi:MAG: hypothetical protein J5966_09415 [Lachnospiraceae bacterium]|nr:hypothetical protein [Lachnospiraceae bacterium]